MKASTLLGLIAVVAIIYAARVGLRTLIGSASQGVSPTCLELVGKTTREDEGRTYIVGSVRNYDLAPDGKRIAALMPADTTDDPGVRSHVTFVLHFFDELERLVPAGK